MANDAKVVCKNVFKNCDKAAFTKAFTLKWIELINQYEKNKGRATLDFDSIMLRSPFKEDETNYLYIMLL